MGQSAEAVQQNLECKRMRNDNTSGQALSKFQIQMLKEDHKDIDPEKDVNRITYMPLNTNERKTKRSEEEIVMFLDSTKTSRKY